MSVRYRSLTFGLVIVILLTVIYANSRQTWESNTNALTLQAPSFIRSASAAELATSAPDTIANEAGISAYFNANRTINLNQVRSQFRTVENETSTYILGSVEIPGWGDQHDAHVYVSTDGWVLAYYSSSEPTAKIFDWISINNLGQNRVVTKLESALEKIANAASAGAPSVSYYDFRYPNATDLTLVMDFATGTDTFEVTLPSSYTYYEHSWSLHTIYQSCCSIDGYLDLNGNRLVSIRPGSNTPATAEGSLSASQLPKDVINEFAVINYFSNNTDSFGGFAVTYQE